MKPDMVSKSKVRQTMCRKLPSRTDEKARL
jgi:hypothetical protein